MLDLHLPGGHKHAVPVATTAFLLIHPWPLSCPVYEHERHLLLTDWYSVVCLGPGPLCFPFREPEQWMNKRQEGLFFFQSEQYKCCLLTLEFYVTLHTDFEFRKTRALVLVLCIGPEFRYNNQCQRRKKSDSKLYVIT